MKKKNYAVLDLFLGDSGKGKIADYLAKTGNAVIRFNGSNNAGHTLQTQGKTFKTHALPSGVLHPHVTNFIGHGCILNPYVLLKEIEQYLSFGSTIKVSGNAHIIFPFHIELDIEREKINGVGSTKQGVSPAYEAKYGRRGIQFKDLLLDRDSFLLKIQQVLPLPLPFGYVEQIMKVYDDVAEKLNPFIVEDSLEFVHSLAHEGGLVFEGAQGTFLDIDIGEYPFVTTSNCTIGSVLTGTGLNLSHIDEVVGVIKAYGSYVGTSTSFKDIEQEDLNELLRNLGKEYGTTTGRPRRLCWLDLAKLGLATKINGPTKLVITRMDTLGALPVIYLNDNDRLVKFDSWGDDLKKYECIEDLPSSALEYINYIEAYLNIPVWAIGTGPDREDLLFRRNLK